MVDLFTFFTTLQESIVMVYFDAEHLFKLYFERISKRPEKLWSIYISDLMVIVQNVCGIIQFVSLKKRGDWTNGRKFCWKAVFRAADWI